MTIRKKILMGNIMITLLTTMLVILICTKYVHLNSSTFPKDIPGSNEGVNALTRTMNILYTFEEEISGMNWEAVPVDGGQSAEVMLIPEKERVEELENLGFHIQAESPYGVSFTNLDAADLGMLASVNNGSSEMMYMSAQGIIIRDSFQAFGQIWITDSAVYGTEGIQLCVFDDHGGLRCGRIDDLFAADRKRGDESAAGT